MYFVSAICVSSYLSGLVQLWGPALAGPPHIFRASHEGSEDLVVVLAATEVAGDAVRELLARRVWIRLQEADRRHREARHAEGALETLFVDDRLLHGMQLTPGREPFNRAHLPSAYRMR